MPVPAQHTVPTADSDSPEPPTSGIAQFPADLQVCLEKLERLEQAARLTLTALQTQIEQQKILAETQEHSQVQLQATQEAIEQLSTLIKAIPSSEMMAELQNLQRPLKRLQLEQQFGKSLQLGGILVGLSSFLLYHLFWLQPSSYQIQAALLRQQKITQQTLICLLSSDQMSCQTLKKKLESSPKLIQEPD